MIFRNINASLLHINNNIKKARQLRKFSQEAMAARLGEKRSSYAEWERDTVPRADILFKIADELGVSILDLNKPDWNPDGLSSAGNGQKEPAPKISLATIQKDLEAILHQQILTRAEIRAYGQYPIGRDAKGDQSEVVKILGAIGTLVAEHEANILREGILPGERS